jgi:hypothetical protein
MFPTSLTYRQNSCYRSDLKGERTSSQHGTRPLPLSRVTPEMQQRHMDVHMPLISRRFATSWSFVLLAHDFVSEEDGYATRLVSWTLVF